jgi:hypothetical protein
MIRTLEFGALLLAGAALCAAEQNSKSPAASPPPRPPAAQPGNPPKNAGAPKPPQVKPGPPLSNPANPVTRLYRMTPEQRDGALEKLPQPMQEQFRKALDRFDHMSPEDQKAELKRVERYVALPRDRQEAFRQALQAFGKMDPEHRRPLATALRQLETMPDAQRRRLINSEEFRSQFTAEELKILSDLSQVMLPPM